MKKLILLFVVFLTLSTSCTVKNVVDKEASEDSLKLKSFSEPGLYFGLNHEELYEQIGTPDDLSNNGNPIYYSEEDGIFATRYDFIGVNSKVYGVVVEFFGDQSNLDFMVDWLTNKYGEPSSLPSGGVGYKHYKWELVDLRLDLEYYVSSENLEILSIDLTYNEPF